jgi:hypothetical protein
MESSERAEVEVKKLMLLHPDIRRSGGALVAYYRPGIGPYTQRKIKVVMGRYYPNFPPQAYVSPHEDIAGDITKYHIYPNGEICFIHPDEWKPRIHNLPFAFSQSKHIVHRAIQLKVRSGWEETPSLSDLMRSLNSLKVPTYRINTDLLWKRLVSSSE